MDGLSGNKKIFILVDHTTACASETFISALKSVSRNCTVVGSYSTYGAFSAKYTFKFSSGSILCINSVMPKFISADKRLIIEGKGISPDIPVKINSYGDLVPFKDKVLSNCHSVILTKWFKSFFLISWSKFN